MVSRNRIERLWPHDQANDDKPICIVRRRLKTWTQIARRALQRSSNAGALLTLLASWQLETGAREIQLDAEALARLLSLASNEAIAALSELLTAGDIVRIGDCRYAVAWDVDESDLDQIVGGRGE